MEQVQSCFNDFGSVYSTTTTVLLQDDVTTFCHERLLQTPPITNSVSNFNLPGLNQPLSSPEPPQLHPIQPYKTRENPPPAKEVNVLNGLCLSPISNCDEEPEILQVEENISVPVTVSNANDRTCAKPLAKPYVEPQMTPDECSRANSMHWEYLRRCPTPEGWLDLPSLVDTMYANFSMANGAQLSKNTRKPRSKTTLRVAGKLYSTSANSVPCINSAQNTLTPKRQRKRKPRTPKVKQQTGPFILGYPSLQSNKSSISTLV